MVPTSESWDQQFQERGAHLKTKPGATEQCPLSNEVQSMGAASNPVSRKSCLLETAHAETMRAETGQPCPAQLCKTANKKSFSAPKQFRPIAEVTQAKASTKHQIGSISFALTVPRAPGALPDRTFSANILTCFANLPCFVEIATLLLHRDSLHANKSTSHPPVGPLSSGLRDLFFPHQPDHSLQI